jgi:hypothetical protein
MFYSGKRANIFVKLLVGLIAFAAIIYRSPNRPTIKQYINSLPENEMKKVLYINFEESRFVEPNLNLIHEIYNLV